MGSPSQFSLPALVVLVAVCICRVSATGFTPVSNKEYPGNVLTTLTGSSVSACQAACNAMPACAMFDVGSFLYYYGRCRLKSAVSSTSTTQFGLTSYIPVATAPVSCYVNYDSCEGVFVSGGSCPADTWVKLNGVSRAITMLSAAPVAGSFVGLSAMHLPAFMNKLGMRTLINAAISANLPSACGIITRLLYTGSSIETLASCSQPDLDDATFYLPLAGSYGGFSGCVAFDPMNGMIPVSAVGQTLDVFESAIGGRSADELPTRVLAPLDAVTWSLMGTAPFRDVTTGSLQGSASGHISFRGATLTTVNVPAVNLLCNGSSSLAIDFDPKGDGLGQPDHAISLTLIGGPVVSFGPDASKETLDLSGLLNVNTAVTWTFLSASDYSMEVKVFAGLSTATLFSKSGLIRNCLLYKVSTTLNLQVTLTITVGPQNWKIGIAMAGPIPLLASPLLSGLLGLLGGSTNFIELSGTRSSSVVNVLGSVTSPLGLLLGNFNLGSTNLLG